MITEPLKIKEQLLANRVVCQPMEGCDCEPDGTPSGYTMDKYLSFAKSGAGLIWLEANAVCPEGKTNARQLSVTPENLDSFRRFVERIKETAYRECGVEPRLVIQLTHSGRQSISPMVMFRHALYEASRPVGDDAVVSDDYLDALPEVFARAARLSEAAGFDGVDVKCCHGYLLMESLCAYTRPGKYGGSFENRTRLLTSVFGAVRASVGNGTLVTSRLGVYDALPRRWGFGADEEGGVDLAEPKALIRRLCDMGLDMLNVTIGNPYYNPYINRPYRRGSVAPKVSPERTLALFYDITKQIKAEFPALPVVSSGMSYYGKDVFVQAERMLRDGVCDLVGFGRMTLAYPQFFADYVQGKFQPQHVCLACSKCTELMRAHCVVGCPVFNERYRALYRAMKEETA